MAYHYPLRCVLNKALLVPTRDKNDAQEPHRNRGVEGDLELVSKIEPRKPVRTSRSEDRSVHVYTVCFRNIRI